MGTDPLVSVVIPTCNRLPVLRQCVAALAEQEFSSDPWEIVIVDDGSTDDTWAYLQGAALRSPVPVRPIQNRARGPAAARNAGLAAARGEILLMTGDDILASKDWVARHVDAHRDTADNVAVLGHTDWDPRLGTTALMEYLDQGPQFGYGLITDPEDVDFHFFYTSNLSLKKRFLAECGERFDEAYPSAAMEDIDLGYRLHRRGLRIRYQSRALAYHYHPVTWRDFLQRAYVVGRSAAVFYAKFAELRADAPGRPRRHRFLERWTLGLLRPVLEIVGHRPPLYRCYKLYFDYYRWRGYRSQADRRAEA